MRPRVGVVGLAAVVVAGCLSGCGGPGHPAAPPANSSPVETITRLPAKAPRAAQGPVVKSITAADLGQTWRPGCPVGPEALRSVEIDYIGSDGDLHRGTFVVHNDVVDDVIAIFADLQRQRFPIAKMRTADHYAGAEDELSMQDNNTSAFNCRPLPGNTGWSLHAYGRAVDVNPLVNPYRAGNGDVQPKTALRYLDRGADVPGMLHAGDPAVRAFTDRGWRWGGAWRDPVDYQHFERD